MEGEIEMGLLQKLAQWNWAQAEKRVQSKTMPSCQSDLRSTSPVLSISSKPPVTSQKTPPDAPATPVFYVVKNIKPARAPLGTFEIVGESYYTQNFLQTGRINPEWALSRNQLLEKYNVGDCISKYTFEGMTCQIIREPSNPIDIKALRVDIAGTKVGYIARKDQARISSLLDHNYIHLECYCFTGTS